MTVAVAVLVVALLGLALFLARPAAVRVRGPGAALIGSLQRIEAAQRRFDWTGTEIEAREVLARTAPDDLGNSGPFLHYVIGRSCLVGHDGSGAVDRFVTCLADLDREATRSPALVTYGTGFRREVLGFLGMTHLQGGDYDAALTVLRGVLDEFDPRTEPAEWSEIARHLSQAERVAGNNDRARELAERSMVASELAQDPAGLALSLRSRAMCDEFAGDHAVACTDYRRAAQSLEREVDRQPNPGFRAALALTLLLLARSLAETGRFEEAAGALTRADALDDGSWRDLGAHADYFSSVVARLSGRAAEALERAGQAEERYRTCQMGGMATYAHREQARALAALGRDGEARTGLMTAVDEFDRHGAHGEADRTRDDLAALGGTPDQL